MANVLLQGIDLISYVMLCHTLNVIFRFVLKTDDDVFVEIFHLFNFVSAVYGFSPGPSLVRSLISHHQKCNIINFILVRSVTSFLLEQVLTTLHSIPNNVSTINHHVDKYLIPLCRSTPDQWGAQPCVSAQVLSSISHKTPRKYFVSFAEFPIPMFAQQLYFRHLPKYCSGAAYLVTPTLINRLLKVVFSKCQHFIYLYGKIFCLA